MQLCIGTRADTIEGDKQGELAFFDGKSGNDDWQHIDITLYPGWIGEHSVIDVLLHDK